MLIQIIFFVLMLFGVAALTIDMGLARLTQVQMQNAADTAALEGLRYGNEIPPSPIPGCRPMTDPDSYRRCAAAYISAWTFDANFNLNDNDQDPSQLDPRRIGAGPKIEITDAGQAEYGGLSAYNAQDSGVYSLANAGQPTLQINKNGVCEDGTTGNCQYGDMVSGQYNNSNPHLEDSQYNRADFTPDPSSTPSFLVRLRRTNDFQGLDNKPAVSSSGPPLALMFGRGTFIHKDDDPNDPNPNNYNPRIDGITVRATAIANARPALRVGSASNGLPGVTTAAITSTCWEMIVATASPLPLPLECVGLPVGVPAAQTVGTQITPNVGSLTIPAEGAYVPIFDGSQRVIGFGFVQTAGGNIAGIPSWVATGNATALVTGGLQIQGLNLLSAQDGALLVPVLSR